MSVVCRLKINHERNVCCVFIRTISMDVNSIYHFVGNKICTNIKLICGGLQKLQYEFVTTMICLCLFYICYCARHNFLYIRG
jgi:hypothetical protein